MKFENRGKWIKETEDKLAAYDTQEHPDFLDGDNKVCTFEDDEVTNFEEDDLDVVEEDDTLDSPEDEEMDLAMEAAMPPMGQRKRIEFEDDIVKVYDGNKEIYAGAEDYEPMQDEDWKWDNVNKYYKFGKYIKVCCESSQKNEAFGPDDVVSIAKQMDFKKQYLQGKDKRKVNANSFYFDNVYAVDDNTGSSIPGAKLGMKYKDLAAALDKFFGESAQKNEAIGDSSWNEAVRQIAGGINKILPSLTAAKFAYDEIEDLQAINKSDYMSCFNNLIDYFNKEALLMKHIANIDVDANDYNKWFKPLADFVKKRKIESAQKNEGSNWEYSVSVLDNYGNIQYSTDCKSQSDIDNAIKKYKARAVELRNADNCTTIEVTKDLVDNDGNILKSQSMKKISL